MSVFTEEYSDGFVAVEIIKTVVIKYKNKMSEESQNSQPTHTYTHSQYVCVRV